MQASCYAPKSWQNGILLRCSCISKIGPSRHAVKHRSLWSNQRNACNAFIISSLTCRTEGSSHKSRRFGEKNPRIHPSISLNDLIRELERIGFFFVLSCDSYGPFSTNTIFWNKRSFQPHSLLPRRWSNKASSEKRMKGTRKYSQANRLISEELLKQNEYADEARLIIKENNKLYQGLYSYFEWK